MGCRRLGWKATGYRMGHSMGVERVSDHGTIQRAADFHAPCRVWRSASSVVWRGKKDAPTSLGLERLRWVEPEAAHHGQGGRRGRDTEKNQRREQMHCFGQRGRADYLDNNQWDVAPGDQGFVFVRGRGVVDIAPRLILAKNWFTELRERMGGN